MPLPAVRRILRAIRWQVMPLVILLALPLLGQQVTTKTVTFDTHFFNDPSYCSVISCYSPDCSGPVTRDLGQFTDPLSANTKIRAVSFTWHMGNDKSFSWQGIPNVAVLLNGTLLAAENITTSAVCSSSAAQDYVFASADYPNGFPGYVHSGGGSTGQNTISMTLTATDAGIVIGDHTSVSLTYEVLPPIEFNVTDSAPESERRILLSNLHQGYPYPHFQSIGAKDSEVPMFARARGQSGQYEANLTVYLRVTDPEDTAPYMNLATNVLAKKNDNVGPLPTLDGTGITAVAGTPNVYQATSGANGEVDFTLKLKAGTAAGDNYQIEASFDQTFPTGASWKSGTLTAWKRVFVEKHKMLRNGMRINKDADAGATSIQVLGNHYQGNQGSHRTIKKGDHIVLTHSPALNRANVGAGWYVEYHNVADVQSVQGTGDYLVMLGTRQGKNIQPETLLMPFRRELLDEPVGDGIALIAGQILTVSDVFDAPNTLLAQYDANGTATSAFPQSFVEYEVLSDSSLPSGSVPVPWVRPVTGDDKTLQDLADRWSSSVNGTGATPPDHQLLLIGDTDSVGNPPEVAGVTTHSVANEIASIVYRGAIDYAVTVQGNPHYRQNPDNWAAKNEVHELTHQWKVDLMWQGTGGADSYHCPADSVVFDSTSTPPTSCVEAESAGSAGGAETQSDNMIARYHLRQLNGVWNSEYFEIRRRVNPFVP